MKGKIGLVVGLGVGYVLGTRAGRERYEQIKTQWLKVWNLDPVQDQVTKVKGFVGEKTAAIPGAVWNGVVRLTKTATGPGTPGEKLDATIATGKDVVEQVSDAAEDAVDEAKEKATEKKPAAKARTAKPSATKSQNGK
ncbi:hypothetical protein M2317_000893 [Microbacterium sp. ZKA21]|jgi:hypothetical protein|uniref:hypothetical protein n=1 Tax=Microbacterium sp. ZKA21 TaxID=3381694 RepID=UPI003D25CBF5